MIEEMVCSPNPQWVEDFKKEIIEKFNINRTDAILISGKVCKIVREQKAIDDDAVRAIVEEQVLKAIEKQKQVDIARFKQIIHQVVIKELGMPGELARHISTHIVKALESDTEEE